MGFFSSSSVSFKNQVFSIRTHGSYNSLSANHSVFILLIVLVMLSFVYFPDVSHLIDYFTTITRLFFHLQVWLSHLLCPTVTIILSRGLNEIEVIVLSINHLSRQFKKVIHIKPHTEHILPLLMVPAFW